MSLSVDDLKNLVIECRMGMSPDQIRQRVEEMETPDLEVICDGQSFEIFLKLSASTFLKFYKGLIYSPKSDPRLWPREEIIQGRKNAHCKSFIFMLQHVDI